MTILPSAFSVSIFDTQNPILGSIPIPILKNPDTFPILDTDSIDQAYKLALPTWVARQIKSYVPENHKIIVVGDG